MISSAFTSFACWNAKLASNALNLLCLHMVYIIIIADITVIPCLYWAMYSLSVSGVDNNVSSNVLLFRKIGSVTS